MSNGKSKLSCEKKAQKITKICGIDLSENKFLKDKQSVGSNAYANIVKYFDFDVCV